VVFNATELAFRYIIPGRQPCPAGSGTMMANQLLIPVAGWLAGTRLRPGTVERVIAVDRPVTPGPVVPAVAGKTVLEQRGDTVVALG
jgi:hypothetical protein